MNLKINKKLANKLENLDIFNPYIVVILILAFIVVAIPILYFSDELPSPSFQLYIFIFIGILFFIFGIEFPNIIAKFSGNFKNKINTLKNIKRDKFATSPINSSIFKLSNISKSLEYILLAMVLIVLIVQIANFIIIGGIPLLSGTLKINTPPRIWLISYIFFIIGINILFSKYNRKIYYIILIIGLGLFALTGYRTTPIAILLSVFITLYYSRNMKIRYQILFAAIIPTLLIIVGFVAVQAIEWQNWRLNPLELISYRAGFTLNILDRAIPLAGSTNGELFFNTLTGFFKPLIPALSNYTDPRVIVGGVVTGKAHSITSTIFGPAILDFTWIGMGVQMFLIGFILKLLHIIQKYFKGIATAFYGIILAQTIIWIETGPTDFIVWLFYLLGIITIFYCFYHLANYADGANDTDTDGAGASADSQNSDEGGST